VRGRSRSRLTTFAVVAADPAADNLPKIDNIVVLMMENRSFDHMLGYLKLEEQRDDVEGLTPGLSNSDGQKSYFIHHLDHNFRRPLDRALQSASQFLRMLEKTGRLSCPSAALFAAEWVTLDRQQLQRGSPVVQTLSPADFLTTAKS
jgi:hypothetical protein